MSRQANLSTGAKVAIGIGVTLLALPLVGGLVGAALMATSGGGTGPGNLDRSYKPRQPRGISLK